MHKEGNERERTEWAEATARPGRVYEVKCVPVSVSKLVDSGLYVCVETGIDSSSLIVSTQFATHSPTRALCSLFWKNRDSIQAPSKLVRCCR